MANLKPARNLDCFFNPKSVALIGASSKPGKLGNDVLKNLLDGGFKGQIYPINIKEEPMFGLKSYKNVLDVPDHIDLAVFVIPAVVVPQALRDCGQKGCKGAVIISSGFKETGGKGVVLEKEVATVAKEYGIKVIGPNCLGIINPGCFLNASFATEMPLVGNVAMITQSGALGTAILDWSMQEGLGFSSFISLGNKVDVGIVDLVTFLGEEDDVKAILAYVEDMKNGQEFIKIAKQVTRKKPIVIMKAGRTAAGARAVSSHTGSLAGSDAAFEAAFLQSGVIRANYVEELFDYAMAFSSQPLPKTRNIAIVTNAGGPGIMATDAVEKASYLSIAKFSDSLATQLKKALPSGASVRNPVDVMGDAKEDRYKVALDLVAQDDNIGGITLILTPQTSSQIPETAKMLCSMQKTGKPVFGVFMGGDSVASARTILKDCGVPSFPFPERAVAAMNALARQAFRMNLPCENVVEVKDKDIIKADEILSSIKKKSIKCPPEHMTRQLMDCYKVPMPQAALARNVDEANSIASSIGYPVVLKIASVDVVHKTDVGGVVLNIDGPETLEKTYNEIINNVKKAMPEAKIDGVFVSKQVGLEDGIQLVVGATRDPQFGPVIMFGLGGISVEVLKDVSFRVAPLTKSDAHNMIQQIKSYPILAGIRGAEGINLEACSNFLLKMSTFMMDFPIVKELDINPLFAERGAEGNIMALDIRVVLDG